MASKRPTIYTWLLAALVISTVCLACQAAEGTATSDPTKPAKGLSEAKQAVNTAASTEPGPGYRAEDDDILSSTKSVQQKQADAKATQSVTTKSAEEEKEHTGAYQLMGERADGEDEESDKKTKKSKKSSDSSEEYFSNEKYQYGGLQQKHAFRL